MVNPDASNTLGKRCQEWLLLLGVLGYGLCMVPLSVMGRGLTYIPGGPEDGALNNYLLEHGFRWLTGLQERFWDAPFFFPSPAVITYSDSHLGTLPLYAAFRLLGLDRESAYQVWFILLFALNYGCCAWVLRRLRLRTAGVVVGAFLFAFGLPMVAQLLHSQLLPRFLVPLAFYFTYRFIEKPERKGLAALLICLVWQFYCTIYIGAFLLGLLAVFGVAHAVARRSALSGRLRLVLGDPASWAIVLAAGLALVVLMRPYYDTSREYGYREWSQIASMLPRWQSYLSPVGHSLVWSWSRIGADLPMAWEHRMFVGIVPWLCVFISFVHVRRSGNEAAAHRGFVAAALATLVLAMISTISIDGWTLYGLATALPGVGAIRGVTRIILVLLFLFATCVAFALTRLQLGHSHKIRVAVLGSVVTVSLLDQTVRGAEQVRYSKNEIQHCVEQLKQQIVDQPGEPAVFAYMPAPPHEPSCPPHLVAMLASQDLGIPTVNGHSGSLPRNFEFYHHYDQLWALEQWVAYAGQKYRNEEHPSTFQMHHLAILGTPQHEAGAHSLSVALTPLSKKGYRARLSTLENRIVMKPLENRRVTVMVTNESEENWPALGDFNGRNKLGLSCRWLSAEGEPLTEFVARVPLKYDIPPSLGSELEIDVTAPEAPGEYLVELDLVQEHVTWFRDMGSATHGVPVSVVNQGMNGDEGRRQEIEP